MISSIVLTGLLKEVTEDNFRLIETHNSDALQPDNDIICNIPLLYWTRDKNNPLNNAPINTFAVIKGHLENDPKRGLYVLVESLHLGNK